MANYVSNHTGAQIDAAVENVGVLDGKVTTLSEEIAGQTAPESFGAKGDGVTDDAAAIAQALASGRNVVFDGAKTYAVGSTITIPADAFVDFRGATIVPMGNHDVIRVGPGSRVENLVIRCTGVAGWDSSAMVFYGGDMFSASNPTRINNVKMFNDVSFNDGKVNAGNGFYLYADDLGQFIEGVSVVEAQTCGFGKGVYIYSTAPYNDINETIPNAVFIGGNVFRGYWSYRDTYGIYMDAHLPANKMTNNFFTDLNIQSDYYGGSVYAVWCNGFNNYFGGCIYDYSVLVSFQPNTAVYFAQYSNQNVVEVTSGGINRPEWCIDLGGQNRIVKRNVENVLNVPYSSRENGMIGNQDDALAFIDKRATCILESLDGEPYMGDISNVFDPTPTKDLIYRTAEPNSDNRRAIITIKPKKVLGRITNFILQFNSHAAPKSVKVTFFTAENATVLYNTETNANDRVIISPIMDEIGEVLNVSQITVELGGFNLIAETAGGTTYGEWALQRIMAVDSYGTGNAWLRRNGGEMCGNIKFMQNTGPVLTDAAGKRYMLTVSTSGALSTVEIPEEEEEEPEIVPLTPVMVAGPSWFDSESAGADPTAITSVTFDASYAPTGNEDASWPCDEDGYGYIMAYLNGTDVTITPTTGSENIQINTDSTFMFANDGTKANFAAIASISGTEMLTAKKGTDATSILRGNTVITNPISIPDGVTNMKQAFQGCTTMASSPELPEGVVSINNAFTQCKALLTLPELPSTIVDMEYAFHGCTKATKAPSVIPASVNKIFAAFRNCWYLNGNIEVNAEALTSYSSCFENTSRDGGAVTLTGSCPLLAELAATNTQGKVTVASA